jgi:hypothetical protein
VRALNNRKGVELNNTTRNLVVGDAISVARKQIPLGDLSVADNERPRDIIFAFEVHAYDTRGGDK